MTEAITTEQIPVTALLSGDVLHVSYPSPHLLVSANESRRQLLCPNRRNRVTLEDSDGITKQFYLSPNRSVQRVTNPAIPIGPWSWTWGWERDLTADLSRLEREDALWHRLLWPLSRPFVWGWNRVLDIPCRIYALKLHAGFLLLLSSVVLAAAALAARTAPEHAVAIAIVGSFIVERWWERWRSYSRRKLFHGIKLRVRYRRSEPPGQRMRYGTLELCRRGSIILGGRPGQIWNSLGMVLRQRKKEVARCEFANDLRGDDARYVLTTLANQIRHRITVGSNRGVVAPSYIYDPEKKEGLDITIYPVRASLNFRDRGTKQYYEVKLQMPQVRVLADSLEAMDERSPR